MNLVDPSYELIDPNPDLHASFIQFNDAFFFGALAGCEVSWSNRMTQCAGLCSFQPRSGYCSIRLSVPLLKLRPRKDFVETLLHEMIHAYLFLTSGNRDRDGHGPEFQSHMHRINGIAGTRITVFHSFHAEVALYKQHWWRCQGRCQSQGPFYGWVKRSMNRAPSKNDIWWNQHEQNCGGKFIKVKEPDPKPKPNSRKRKSDDKPVPESGNRLGASTPSTSDVKDANQKRITDFTASTSNQAQTPKQELSTAGSSEPSRKSKSVKTETDNRLGSTVPPIIDLTDTYQKPIIDTVPSTSNRLGSIIPPIVDLTDTDENPINNTDQKPIMDTVAPTVEQMQTRAQESIILRNGEPTTRIQFRLHTGQRITGTFHPSMIVGNHLRTFVVSADPSFAFQLFSFFAGFPPRKLEDEDLSVEGAGLNNSVVTVRIV